MPNPAKPTELKKRQGTYRVDRDPSQGNLAVVPAVEPDAWDLPLPQVMDRVLEAGVPWLGATDAPKLALLADAVELHERAKQGGSIRDVIEAQKNISSLMSQLGFDPTSRARLGLAEVTAQSKLEELRARSSKTKVSDKGDAG